MAITPAKMVQFSKFWWLNNLFFQELSNDVHNTHVARVHMPKNVSRSWYIKAKNHVSLTKTYFWALFNQIFLMVHLRGVPRA